MRIITAFPVTYDGLERLKSAFGSVTCPICEEPLKVGESYIKLRVRKDSRWMNKKKTFNFRKQGSRPGKLRAGGFRGFRYRQMTFKYFHAECWENRYD